MTIKQKMGKTKQLYQITDSHLIENHKCENSCMEFRVLLKYNFANVHILYKVFMILIIYFASVKQGYMNPFII